MFFKRQRWRALSSVGLDTGMFLIQYLLSTYSVLTQYLLSTYSHLRAQVAIELAMHRDDWGGSYTDEWSSEAIPVKSAAAAASTLAASALTQTTDVGIQAAFALTQTKQTTEIGVQVTIDVEVRPDTVI
eukprot:7017416-Pyramimonas_sp.AAC.1